MEQAQAMAPTSRAWASPSMVSKDSEVSPKPARRQKEPVRFQARLRPWAVRSRIRGTLPATAPQAWEPLPQAALHMALNWTRFAMTKPLVGNTWVIEPLQARSRGKFASSKPDR